MAYLMIVDDDEDFSSAIAEMLRNAGHQVEVQLDTRSAEASMERRRPDLVILDVMFPEDSSGGFKLARVIRHHNEELKGLPVLFLTAINTKFPLGFGPRDLDDLWLPAADFVEKPVDFDFLENKVSFLLRGGTRNLSGGANEGENAGRTCWTLPGALGRPRLAETPAAEIPKCRERSFSGRTEHGQGSHFQWFKPGPGALDGEFLQYRLINDSVGLMSRYRDIFACLTVRPLLARVSEHARTQTGALAAAVYLLDDSGKELVLEAHAGDLERTERIAIGDRSIVATAARRGRACADTEPLVGQAEPASVLVMPIGDKALDGVIEVIKFDGAFSAAAEQSLRELSLVAWLGIGNMKRGNGNRWEQTACDLERADPVQAVAGKLLDLATIRAGKFLGDLRPVHPAELLRNEVEACWPQAHLRGLAIDLQVRGEESLVRADPDGLRLIFANLLDNAVKYSADRGKKVEVRLLAEKDHVRVLIRDWGIGIPADDQTQIFEEFHRAENAAWANVSGSGLGLAFVKELVDRYGGRIGLESTVGSGTSVWVEFPTVSSPGGACLYDR